MSTGDLARCHPSILLTFLQATTCPFTAPVSEPIWYQKTQSRVTPCSSGESQTAWGTSPGRSGPGSGITAMRACQSSAQVFVSLGHLTP